MTVCYIAPITGKTGVWTVKKQMAWLKTTYQPDVIIANANSATGTGGLGKQHASYLKKLGIDCITAGDCIFQKEDLRAVFPEMPFVLRPANISENSPGNGIYYFSTKKNEKVAVISLLGQFGHFRLTADNPFAYIEKKIAEVQKEADYIIVDFFALATAEKKTMGYFLRGKVSAVIGSGARAATADAQIFDGKTAYITDAGRTGSFDSVGGYMPKEKIKEYRTGLFEYSKDSWQRPCLQGVAVDIDASGNAQSVERIFIETEKYNSK